MNEVIKKKIQEYTIEDFERIAMETDYAIEANEDTCKINEADAGAFYKEGFISGANFAYSLATEWIDVKERLPEVTEENIDNQYLVKGYYEINGKQGNVIYDVVKIDRCVFKHWGKMIFGTKHDFILTHWRYI